MNGGFVIAAVVLLLAVLPLALVGMRAGFGDGVTALVLAGAVSTTALVCVGVGLGSSSMGGVALIAGVMTWVGGLVFARFLDDGS